MATGAGDDYWEGPNLPSVIKHCILRRYSPIFLSRTSKQLRKAVVVDGYAGRGVYDDGTPGSAGMMLEWALQRKLDQVHPVEYILRFFETNRTSYQTLSRLCAEYANRGVNVTAERVNFVTRLRRVVDEADGLPLFLFVDPTGIGLPFADLVAALNRPRKGNWPPTEALINFSYEAIRRIGGHVRSAHSNVCTMEKLDRTLDGKWWRKHFAAGVTDDAVEAVVKGFVHRLSCAAGAFVASIPVRRDLHYKPLYSLVFVTRNQRGAWHFGDATAKCLDEGRKAADKRAGRLDLGPSRAALEARALPDIENNLLSLVAEKGEVTVGDYPLRVFGDHYGEVGETVVRTAIKSLHARGLTPSTGVGGKIENLRIAAGGGI